jgi:biopolymer transport protein ExbD
MLMLPAACEPAKPPSDEIVVVRISGMSGRCASGDVTFDCSEAGAALRKRFPDGNPEIMICADRDATFEVVGAAVKSIQMAAFIKVGFGARSRGPCTVQE